MEVVDDVREIEGEARLGTKDRTEDGGKDDESDYGLCDGSVNKAWVTGVKHFSVDGVDERGEEEKRKRCEEEKMRS